ncbi:hypothetical protein [Streptomyces sp. NPDC090029]|uniref:hypothetical protein n=1 Tax=Streptomyces sp. NPDC090029 TaxID=3365924 RepID=UPI003805A1C7
MRRAARVALWLLLPGELVVLVLLVGGVEVPFAVVAAAEVLVLAVLALEAAVWFGLYRAARRAGLPPGAASARALRGLLPPVVARLAAHELRALHSLVLWALRRRHGVRGGEVVAAGYTGPQTALLWGMVFVSVVETVALAVLIPWPLVHAVALVLDVYGVLFLVALHASCVTRPHVVGADRSLRLRYGALFDLRIPAEAIAGARIERRFPDGRLVHAREDGGLELIVGGQTTVAVELSRSVSYLRPLGGRAEAVGAVRFHADDPAAVVAALHRPAAPSAGPGAGAAAPTGPGSAVGRGTGTGT